MAIARKRLPSSLVQVSVIAFASFLGLRSAHADESGASFWVPGTFDTVFVGGKWLMAPQAATGPR